MSLSASETSNPTIESLQKANKIIRQAQRDDNLPIHIHSIPLANLNFGVFSDAAWGDRPDGSAQGRNLIYASSHALHKGEEAPVGIIDWKSWKLSRKCRSSLSVESQAMADSVDVLNFIRLFFCGLLTLKRYRYETTRRSTANVAGIMRYHRMQEYLRRT